MNIDIEIRIDEDFKNNDHRNGKEKQKIENKPKDGRGLRNNAESQKYKEMGRKKEEGR